MSIWNPMTAQEIKTARKNAGLTQEDAAKVVYRSRRAWQEWERGERKIPQDTFELFLLKTGQHPTMEVREKSEKPD